MTLRENKGKISLNIFHRGNLPNYFFWFSGFLVSGFLVFWFSGFLVSGFLVFWFSGFLVFWFSGFLVFKSRPEIGNIC